MTADDLTTHLLADIHARFYQGVTAKKWAQERSILVQAITYPARYINERGGKLPGRRYREILVAILADIQRHVQAKRINRLSIYILHCVQEHMRHQGDRYYQEAKDAKPAAQVAGNVIRKVRAAMPDSTTRILAETHKVLAQRQVTSRKAGRETQIELF